MKLFLGKSSATVSGKMGSKFCKQSALKQKPGDCSWQAIPSSAKIKINQKMETLTSAASLQAFKKLQPKSKN